MYRLVILFEDSKIISENFNSKDEVEDYLLKQAEKKPIRRADIKNLDTNEREKIY